VHTTSLLQVACCKVWKGATQRVPALHSSTPAAACQVYTPVEMPGGAPFCSGHSILADGRIVAMGGDAGLSGQTNGLLDIRTYSPAAAVADRWQLEEAKLESGQWYPTQLVLPDQRVLALGGLYQDGGAGNPLLSVWDANTGTYSFQRDIPAAVIWQGRNVYPGCEYGCMHAPLTCAGLT
jgi:hypothetical protein